MADLACAIATDFGFDQPTMFWFRVGALLHDVEFPWDVIPMIRGHHERWDGHGYPDGLSGEDIPLPARILCVADVFDALTSQRPYRHAFAARDALQLMQADAGRHFDPEILSRFLRVLSNPQNEARPAEAGRAVSIA